MRKSTARAREVRIFIVWSPEDAAVRTLRLSFEHELGAASYARRISGNEKRIHEFVTSDGRKLSVDCH
jgi:hypothetical protein